MLPSCLWQDYGRYECRVSTGRGAHMQANLRDPDTLPYNAATPCHGSQGTPTPLDAARCDRETPERRQNGPLLIRFCADADDERS